MKKEPKIIPPMGYEIDKENSTSEVIKFKPIKHNFRNFSVPTIGPSKEVLQKALQKANTCIPLKKGIFKEGDIVINLENHTTYIFKRVIYKHNLLIGGFRDFEYYIKVCNINGREDYYISFNGDDCSYGTLRLADRNERIHFFKILSHLSNPKIDSFEVDMK